MFNKETIILFALSILINLRCAVCTGETLSRSISFSLSFSLSFLSLSISLFFISLFISLSICPILIYLFLPYPFVFFPRSACLGIQLVPTYLSVCSLLPVYLYNNSLHLFCGLHNGIKCLTSWGILINYYRSFYLRPLPTCFDC